MAVLAQDSFTRTVSSGWGNADVGGAWTGTGQYASSGLSVSGGAGILVPQNGWGGDMTLNKPVRDVASQVSYTLTAPLNLGIIYIGLKSRISGSSDYEIAAVHNPNGTIDLVVYRNTADTTLATVRLSMASWNTLGKLNMKSEVYGTSPTTIRGKLWVAGTTEPDWQISTTTTPTGTLGNAGLLGIEAYRDAGGTGTVSVAFDDYMAADWSDVPAPVPKVYVGSQPVSAMYLGTTPITYPSS